MTTLMRLVTALPGVVLLTFTWMAFARVLPRGGEPHRWISSKIREETAALAFVTGTAIGFGLVLQGLVGSLR